MLVTNANTARSTLGFSSQLKGVRNKTQYISDDFRVPVIVFSPFFLSVWLLWSPRFLVRSDGVEAKQLYREHKSSIIKNRYPMCRTAQHAHSVGFERFCCGCNYLLAKIGN